ncbi:head GIN domain-containing protein [Flavobacterium sp. PLA-1-15]|uniref:head GIN domain-containing protein n=1 Tax=Flavobacterium sp. PLA-1-15 TaxID=3380533 RepID=UPI003B81F56A
MTRVILFATALLLSLMTNAQVSENRTVGAFTKIKVSQGIELIYTQSSTQEVKVETDDTQRMQYIKTEIEGSTLKVYLDTKNAPKPEKKKRKKNYNSYNGVNFDVLKVYVSNNLVDDFKVSSSASLVVQNGLDAKNVMIDCSSSGSFTGTLKCSTVAIDASSSSDVDANVVADAVNVVTNSSADVELSGTTEKITIKSSSSADCKAKNLIAKTAVVEASSSSDAVVYASEKLTAIASSSASITYFGNPANVDKSESSSGSVSNR